jgi:hypothetical protein
VAGGSGSPPVSQCNMAWRIFLCARGSRCWSFDSPWGFIHAKCGSSVSARFFDSRSSRSLLLCPSCLLRSPLWSSLVNMKTVNSGAGFY